MIKCIRSIKKKPSHGRSIAALWWLFVLLYQKSLELSEYGTIEHEDESVSPAFNNSELALKSSVDSVLV